MEFVIDVGILVAVIIALGELFKKFDYVKPKYLPAMNLVLGVVGGLIYLSGDLKENILMGLAVGLTASGVFDMSKVFKKE